MCVLLESRSKRESESESESERESESEGELGSLRANVLWSRGGKVFQGSLVGIRFIE